jgi:Ca2+-transporting ATPase
MQTTAGPSRAGRPPRASVAPEAPWHTLATAEVADALATGPEGLTAEEATARAQVVGPNRLEDTPPPHPLTVLVHQFQSPLIYILVAATLVTVALGEYVDAAVIGAIMALNAVIGFLQERRAERAVAALGKLVAPRAHVLRAGREEVVDAVVLVPGDVVLLESGNRVPADLRLASASTLAVDESLLTGESAPARKHTHPVDAGVTVADRGDMAYSGTTVSTGRGRGFVVATGATTELGRIAEQVRSATPPPTPMQTRMAHLATLIGIAVGVASVASMGVGVAIGEAPSDMFMLAVALAVAAIPEGLPVVFTITLAIGVRRMAHRNAIVRRLPAVETLGSTTVIGSDKTGTLTENRMTVRALWANRTHVDLGAPATPETTPETSGRADHEAVHLTLLAGVLTNDASFTVEDGHPQGEGDPTELALLAAAWRAGVDPAVARDEWSVDAEIPFESERRYSATFRRRAGEQMVFVKGAPERVLDLCTTLLTDDGTVDVDPEAVHAAAHELGRRGLRVLAMAYGPAHDLDLDGELGDDAGLTFLGLQGMMDPPRDGVVDAVRGCRESGMRVVMITGDHAITARTIAAQIGIDDPDAPVLTGQDLDRFDDEALAEQVATVNVYARVAPEHKLRVVRALRERGEVVAVTGDGVNDAPALRAADIGIAMGRDGTDVAREAADMVLADDNFVSIHAAVEEGRVAFDNVRKVTFFLLSTGVATVITLLAALTLRWPIIFVPAQLLWLNLVTNGLQDVALAFEPGERGILARPPRRRDEGVMSRLLWERTVLAASAMAAGTLAVFRTQLDGGAPLDEARTAALTTMVLFMAFHVGNVRSEHRSAFRLSPFANPFLLVSAVAAVAVHAAALHWGPTQTVLRVAPIGLDVWLTAGVIALSVVAVGEAHKAIRHRPSR